MDSAREAITAFHKWNDAFNARDMETQISQMHFPHLRLTGNNEFQLFKTPDDFRIAQKSMTE